MGRNSTGKRITPIIFIALFTVFLLCMPHSAVLAVNIPTGEDAPEFILTATNDEIISLSDYKEKIVVLIYLRPDQERSHLALKDGKYVSEAFNDKDIQVLGLFAEPDTIEEIRKIVEDYKVNFPILVDAYRDVYSDYGIRVYPSTIIIDKYGKVAYSIPGHALTYKLTLEANLRYLLGEIDEEQLKEMVSPAKEKTDESGLKAERTYNLALKFAEAGLFDNAMEAVMKSIEAGPDMAKSYMLRGSLLLKLKEADQAIESFEKALELDPLSHHAKTGLGSALFLKGDIDKAIEILEEAAVANPYPAVTYYELGKAYERKGEKDTSIKMYRKALEKTIGDSLLSLPPQR